MWTCHYFGETMEIREVDLSVYTFHTTKWMIFDEVTLEKNC